jgi:hypothetical protein
MAKDFLGTQIRTYKIIASGSSPTDRAKLLIYGVDAAANYDGHINQTYFNTSSIGSDVFLFISGSKNSKNVATNRITVFGGDAYISGVLFAELGFSGSHTTLIGGAPAFLAGPGITLLSNSLGQVVISSSLSFSAGPGITVTTASNGRVEISSSYTFVAGPNVTIVTNSNGRVEISSSTTSTAQSGSILSFGIADFGTSIQTTHTNIGQIVFNAAEHTGSIYLRSVLSTTNASVSASIRLYNVSVNDFVDIGGTGVKVLTTTSTTPVIKESIDLRTAANFSAGQAIYELQLAAQATTDAVYLGGAEFRVTGSVGAQAAATSTAYFLSNSAYPDTGLPRLAFTNGGKITLVPDKTSNEAPTYLTKTMRLTFQDGIQRIYTGSVALFLSSTLNGQGGYDASGSIATNGEGWYYCYMVPSGSNTSTGSLAVIASKQCPTGSTSWGPSGYSNFRYIGPVFWATTGKGTPGFEPFYQTDSKTFTFLNHDSHYYLYQHSNALPTSSLNVTDGSGTTKLPTTVSKIFAQLEQYHTSALATSILSHRIYLPLAYELSYQPYFESFTNGTTDWKFVDLDIPIGYPLENQPWNITHQTFWQAGTPVSDTLNVYLKWKGFEDGFLDTAKIGPTSNTASIGVGTADTVTTITTSVAVTASNIFSYTMPQDSVIDFDANFVARGQTNSFNRARYRRNFLAYRSGSGNAVIQGGTVFATATDIETIAGYDVNIWALGTNIIFDVTASTDEGVNWKLTVRKNQV